MATDPETAPRRRTAPRPESGLQEGQYGRLQRRSLPRMGVTHTAPEVDGAGLGNSAPETDGAGLGNDASETDGHLEMCGGQEGGAGDEVEVARNGNGIDNGRRGFPEHGFPDRGLPERDSRAGFRSGIPERDSGTRSLGSASGGARVRTVERSPVVADPYRTTGRTCGRAVFRDGIPERDSGAGFRSGLPAVEVIVDEVDTAAVGPVGGENPDVVETGSGSGSDRRGFPERGIPERDFGAGFRSGISEQNFGAEFRSRIPEQDSGARDLGNASGGAGARTAERRPVAADTEQRPVAAETGSGSGSGSGSGRRGFPERGERASGAGFRSGFPEWDSGARDPRNASGGAGTRTAEQRPAAADAYGTSGRTCGRAVFRSGIPERAVVKERVTDTSPEVDGAGPGNSAPEADGTGDGDRTAGGPVREAWVETWVERFRNYQRDKTLGRDTAILGLKATGLAPAQDGTHSINITSGDLKGDSCYC